MDFAIINKGNIIFQEIFIENIQDGNNYYHNFGIDGLEPGARHNIHIYSREELLICSFFLYGIAQESYIIEDVAIEENSIVYILPEHFQEDPEAFTGLSDPDAVYGMTQVEEDEKKMQNVMGEGSWEKEIQTHIEVFNYTNYDLFRAYLISGDEEKDKSDYLLGKPLRPSESRTLSLLLDENQVYTLELLDAEGKAFHKSISLPLEADFLVLYDNDKKDADILLALTNGTNEEIIEINVISQKDSKRVELLQGDILASDETRNFIVEGHFEICDIIAMTADKRKLYLFDNEINEETIVLSDDF